MNNNRKLLLILMSGVMSAALILIGLATTTSARADASNPELRVDKTVFGLAELQWATVGEFTDDLTQPVNNDPDVLNDLGEVTLGFLLEDGSADAISGYVDLDNTLVFTKSYDVDMTIPTTTSVVTRDTGPAVSGTFDGVNFTLTSERFSHTTEAGQTVERQFRLTGTASGNEITGEYRETFWGYSLEDVTIVGDFALKFVQSPVVVPTAVGMVGGCGSLPCGSARATQFVFITLTAALLLTGFLFWRRVAD